MRSHAPPMVSTRSSTSPPRRTSTGRSSGPAEFILTDVLGTQVLLDHARQHGIRHLQVSTDEVYGDIPLDAEPCTEDAPIRASSPYSASKAGGDLQVLAYVRTYGVDALITRGANTYGARQYPEKFLPLFITNAFDGQHLPVYGDGKQRREWLHVAGSLRGHRARAAQGRGRQRLQRRRAGAREHGRRSPHPRPDGREPRPRPPRRRPPGPRPALLGRLEQAAAASAGSRSTRSTAAVSRRPSTGTASTATGGSRSSPATTSGTTTSSTPLGLALANSASPQPFAAGRSPCARPGSTPSGRAASRRRCSCRAR